MSMTRQKVVDLVCSWEGKNEADGSFKSIIDIYNSYDGTLPRGTKMLYNWEWCACTWSALAIKLKYTKIMPIEISCYYIIEAAKKMGCWKEKDSYIAKPGDAVLYDWGDSGKGENTGGADHIGTIIETNKDKGYFIVMEGNYNQAVKRRKLSINGRYIRGFIAPKYDEEVKKNTSKKTETKKTTTKKTETKKTETKKAETKKEETKKTETKKAETKKEETKKAETKKTTTKKVTATAKADKYDEKLAGTYKTTANLYMRNDAGKKNKALCVLSKGTKVKCYGYYSLDGKTKWYYIQVTLDGVIYTGFSHSSYLTK